MTDRRPVFGLAVLALLIGAAVLAQTWVRPEPSEEPVVEPVPDDTGPSVDLEHPSERDIAFLTEVLATGTPDGRRSAARAFAVSGDPRGVEPLFDAAVRGGEDDVLFCLAALEILRLQPAELTWRELVRALERVPPLPEGCRQEVRDRHGLIDGSDAPALAGAEDADPTVRAWSARRLADVAGADEAYVALVSDPSPAVRRAAWLALVGRDTSAIRDELSAAAEHEDDAAILSLSAEVLR